MTKALRHGVVHPQYIPRYIQAPVLFLFTQHLLIFYITTLNHVNVLSTVFGADLDMYAVGIVLSI